MTGRQLGYSVLNLLLIPTFYRRTANLMGDSQLTLTDPTIVGFEDFESIGFGGS
jgi:hypothetical protein